MNRKTISILSNISLAGAALIGFYVIIQNWLVGRSLPPGACSVDDYRPLVYTAIGLALVSFTLSFFEKDKGDGRGPEEDDSTVLEEDDSTGPEVDDSTGPEVDDSTGPEVDH